MKSLGVGLMAALIVATGGGCKKSPSQASNPQSLTNSQPSSVSRPPPATLARVHWLGKKRIADQKTSAYFMNLWDMPEAARLESETLDKLALALTGERRLALTNQVSAAAPLSLTTNQEPIRPNPEAAATNQTSEAAIPQPQATNQPPAPLLSAIKHPLATSLRPLLDDLVRQEGYMEIQQAKDQPGELALAIRLDTQRAELWTSNLTAVLGSMADVQSLPAAASRLAWQLPLAPHPCRLDLARADDWTLLGLSSETNNLLAEMSHRIRSDQASFPARPSASSFQLDPTTRKVRAASASPAETDVLLDLDLDLVGISRALSLDWRLPAGWPRIEATWTGKEGDRIRASGKLSFAKPLELQLEPWNFPTNLIHDPLASFTAVRGVRSWLAAQKWLQHFQIEPVPNQLCAWASGPTPLQTFAATPMTNATSLLQSIGPQIVTELNPWVLTNAFGALEFSKEPARLTWSGIPMFTPTIESVSTPTGPFLFGRVGAEPAINSKPAPSELYAQLAPDDLVYYDWEVTPPKLAHWVYLGQTARLAFVLPQLPPESAAFAFLLAIAPKLGNTGTKITQDGPATLAFVRTSQSGFTALELHLLADWLESPAFPRGFYSLLAPKPAKWGQPKQGKIKIVTPAASTPHPTNSIIRPR